MRGGFWVETNGIIPLSKGRLQITPRSLLRIRELYAFKLPNLRRNRPVRSVPHRKLNSSCCRSCGSTRGFDFLFCGGALLPFVLRAIAGAGMRSGASRDAFPSGAWERHRFNGGAVGFVLEVVAGGEVESCEGEVVAARDWHGACLPGSAFWK